MKVNLMSSTPLTVVALGGNAIDQLSKKEKAGHRSLDNFCRQIAKELTKGRKIIITHGNGPQVGKLFLQQEIAREYVDPLSLNTCVALSQAQIGAVLKQKLADAVSCAGIKKEIIPLLTHVVVSADDPAFQNPTKPIGPAYTEQEAKKIRKNGIMMGLTAEGIYRRVVPSPAPKKILEISTIKNMFENGALVIAVGGGGIPVVIKNRKINPVDAVIDKDSASALLAKEIGAHRLLILTDTPCVFLNYRQPGEKRLKNLKMADAIKYLKEKQFPAGSMGPKVEAAVYFLKNGGKRVIIGHLNDARLIFDEKTGTVIER